MNPISIAEEEGLEEEQEDIDYDAVYGAIDVDSSSFKKSPELENDYLKILGDVAKQGVKETLIGAGGTYGDLLDLAGLGGHEMEEARNKKEFDILERLNQPDHKPTAEELEQLSDDPTLPRNAKFPTSKELRDVNDQIGGPGEPETAPGKYAARSGKIYGSNIAFGQINPFPSVAAGVAGQAVEDLDGGPLMQGAAEIVTLLVTGRIGKPSELSSAKEAVKQKINQLRKLGYPDEQITLAINSASKGKKGLVKASKGAKTEKAFEEFAEHSDEMVNEILKSKIPGYEKGAKHVHEMASEAYGQVVKEAKDLTIKDPEPFFNSMHSTINEIKKTLGNNKAAKDFIIELTEDTLDIISNPNAENFIDFYKRLNSLGKWVGRSQKDRIISNVKNGIKESFKSEGKEGKKLAEKFEKVNEGIRKAYKAEEVMDVMKKSSTAEGIDFKKLNKAFDNSDNVKLFSEVLGPEQTKNIQHISKIGKEVKDFDKSWKATSLISGTPTTAIGNASYMIYSQSWSGLAAVLASKGLEAGARKLAEKSLTDPKFQNLLIRGLNAIKSESPKTFRSVNEAMQKYLDEQGIEIDLSHTKY